MTETAYGRMMREKRKRKPKARGAAALSQEYGFCGARRKDGERCRNTAGYGTTHFGVGKCKHHGGNMPTHIASAAKNKAVLMGAPVDINPFDALIWCIKLTAGEVEFCTQQMELLSKDEWLEHTMIGKQLHVWAKERQRAVDRLAKFSKDAIMAGIAERAVRLAEQYGTSIAKYTKGLLDDLELSEEQQKKAPLVVRKHLALLEGGAPIKPEDRENLRAIPKKTRARDAS